MYYRIENKRLFDYANYKYAENCLETNIITQEELDKDKNKVVVCEYQEETEEGEIVTKYCLSLNPEYDEIELNKAKENKIKENDAARDIALNAGVTYKDILFDSDTDQKINILATVAMIDDKTELLWFGKNNEPLECKKTDLVNIGNLITALDTFCWTQNASIKEQINNAETIEEVGNIEINYGQE